MGPLLLFVENFMPISLETLWCSIFQTRTMMYRYLRLWSDISFSFFKRSMLLKRETKIVTTNLCTKMNPGGPASYLVHCFAPREM